MTMIEGDRIAPLSGVVNLYKPAGISSRAAVDVVKRLVKPAKTGHAGTLDPLATGVLVVCVGHATRLIEYVQRQPKRYRATFLLGRTSPSEDVETEVTMLSTAPQPTGAEIAAAAARLTGDILQRPPAFSALKVGGRRAYALARGGQEVELAPRPIVVHAIEIIDYQYPQLVLDIRCGSGTYIRSLGRDLAEMLGSGAVMSALERTEIGPFTVADASSCDQVSADSRARWLQPARRAVENLPTFTLDAEQLIEVRHGRFVMLDVASEIVELAALAPSGELAAILRSRGAGVFGPSVNFMSQQ